MMRAVAHRAAPAWNECQYADDDGSDRGLDGRRDWACMAFLCVAILSLFLTWLAARSIVAMEAMEAGAAVN